MKKEKYERNKKFIKEFEKQNLTDTLSLILMLILIPLIGLGLDLKLEAFTNACAGLFICEFIWLCGNTTTLLIKAFQNKKYEKNNTKENTSKQQN